MRRGSSSDRALTAALWVVADLFFSHAVTSLATAIVLWVPFAEVRLCEESHDRGLTSSGIGTQVAEDLGRYAIHRRQRYWNARVSKSLAERQLQARLGKVCDGVHDAEKWVDKSCTQSGPNKSETTAIIQHHAQYLKRDTNTTFTMSHMETCVSDVDTTEGVRNGQNWGWEMRRAVSEGRMAPTAATAEHRKIMAYVFTRLKDEPRAQCIGVGRRVTNGSPYPLRARAEERGALPNA